MPRYSTQTDLSPTEAVANAVSYFDSLGLDVVEHSDCCARFEGGGGHVFVTASSGKKTEIELETREWDYHVKKFMRQISDM